MRLLRITRKCCGLARRRKLFVGNQEEWNPAVKRSHPPKRVHGAVKGEEADVRAVVFWGSSEGSPLFQEPGVRYNITVAGS